MRSEEHAIGADRLREREKIRVIRSAPLIISYQARSSILNDKRGAQAKINPTTNTKTSVFNVIRICSPLRAGLSKRTLNHSWSVGIQVMAPT
jgi:hypothetical protein